ncbi:MAG: N-methyl-L-tryptophan oxidase [Bacteroidetes bacterium]|nr:MAG: N-methyl-L-tryptophan oxidase [Bacteroidota bacterium]
MKVQNSYIKTSNINCLSLSELRSSVNQKIAKQGNTESNYDVIVIGVGSMGSSACYSLAKENINVLGIEQFDISHEFGSHTGQSRIIRKAYFEHPNYVPLLEKAYSNWKQFEDEVGEKLYHKTGLLYASKKEHQLLSGVKQSAKLYNLEINELSTKEIKRQFPQFAIPENYDCILEPDAGFLPPERAILKYTERALELGATIKTNEKVINWTSEKDAITLVTNKQIYNCKKLIISAGAWASKLVPQLKPELKVTKQVLAWVIPHKEKDFYLGNFPCWNLADSAGKGLFYGMPILPKERFGNPVGLKIGHHYHGEIKNPDDLKIKPNAEEESSLNDFIQELFPGALKKTFFEMKTCMYTNTSDENFIVDLHPENNNIVVACGFSGHGFKFSSVIGEILRDFAIHGKTKMPIEFLNIKRLI